MAFFVNIDPMHMHKTAVIPAPIFPSIGQVLDFLCLANLTPPSCLIVTSVVVKMALAVMSLHDVKKPLLNVDFIRIVYF